MCLGELLSAGQLILVPGTAPGRMSSGRGWPLPHGDTVELAESSHMDQEPRGHELVPVLIPGAPSL